MLRTKTPQAQIRHIIKKALDVLGLNDKWLNGVLNKNKVKAKDVFMLSSDEDKNYTLIKKDH